MVKSIGVVKVVWIVLTALLIGALVGVGISSYVHSSNSKQGEVADQTTPLQEEAEDPNTPAQEDLYSLEALDSPFYYDFVNGCVGYHTDTIDMVQGGYYVILLEDKGFYWSLMPDGGGEINLKHALPKLSCEPVYVEFTTPEFKEEFVSALEKYTKEIPSGMKYLDKPPVTKLVEGNRTFYYFYRDLPMSEGTLATFHGWEYAKNVEKGKLTKQIEEEGTGYPTDLLRTRMNPEYTKLVEGYHPDFNNELYDKVRHDAYYKVHKKDGSGKFAVITPVYINSIAGEPPYYTFVLNNIILPNNRIEDLNKMLKEKGYESVEEAIDRKDYCKVSVAREIKTLD